VSVRWVAAAVLLVLGLGAVVAAVSVSGHDTPTSAGTSATTTASSGADGTPCARRLRIVTATAYQSVLRNAATTLGSGTDCVGLDVTTADGSSAASAVAATHADAWVADDASWPQLPNTATLAPGRGTVVATSPMYLVTAKSAAPPTGVARTWTGLGHLLAQPTPWHLVVADPAATGAGMVAVGAMAGAVLVADGPLVSALDMMRAWQGGTTVPAASATVPKTANQLAVVPEYALLTSGQAGDYQLTAPTDAAALMRFTLLSTAQAAADPARSAAVDRLRATLTGTTVEAARSAAGLRGPTWPASAPPHQSGVALPPQPATALPTMAEHLMYHVLSTWNPALRRTNMLLVVDVSGSMAEREPGSTSPKIDLVRQGVAQVESLLPATAQLGLWQFGAALAPPNDWQTLVPTAPLTTGQRAAVTTSASKLAALPVGTGLYDTILAAYRYQQAHYTPGVPDQVVLFTDGVNQDDPNTISLGQLTAGLAAADPAKRVQLSVFGFGNTVPVDTLTAALHPVGGQVDQLTDANDVIGAFVHAVSGALSGTPG
jgi:von Willebrand factor type A domain